MPRITHTIALGLGLVGAVVASQMPEFAQQYRQRLGGAIDELARVVERFDRDSRASGETPEGAVRRLRANPDALAVSQGVAMEGNIDRLATLRAHREAMLQEGPFGRVALMVRDGDTDILQAAYRDFEPAMPLTEEGVVASVGGFAVVWGGVLLQAGFLRGLVRRPRRQPALKAPIRPGDGRAPPGRRLR